MISVKRRARGHAASPLHAGSANFRSPVSRFLPLVLLICPLQLGGCTPPNPGRPAETANAAIAAEAAGDHLCRAEELSAARFQQAYAASGGQRDSLGYGYVYLGRRGDYHYIVRQRSNSVPGIETPAIIGVYRCHRDSLPAGFPESPQDATAGLESPGLLVAGVPESAAEELPPPGWRHRGLESWIEEATKPLDLENLMRELADHKELERPGE